VIDLPHDADRAASLARFEDLDPDGSGVGGALHAGIASIMGWQISHLRLLEPSWRGAEREWSRELLVEIATDAGEKTQIDVPVPWLVDDNAVVAAPGGMVLGAHCGTYLGRPRLPVASMVRTPGVRVLVGGERHDSIDKVLRFLGLGEPEPVAADDQGRIQVAALAEALDSGDSRPTIVVLQAGNVHSGAFDDFAAAIPVAHGAGAWVHIDGAFGLFAAASPRLRHLTAGFEAADSWATDAHKTLNVPYDCGIAIVADDAAMRSSMGMHGDYLIQDEAGEPFDRVPEMSRRARATTVWAALASLGRSGVAELVERFSHHATMFAEGIAQIPGAEVLNDVVFTQVCASFGSDEHTREVVRRMLVDGTAWTTGSRWHDRAVLRVALCNWSTTDTDVESTLAALRRAAA